MLEEMRRWHEEQSKEKHVLGCEVLQDWGYERFLILFYKNTVSLTLLGIEHRSGPHCVIFSIFHFFVLA
jgi:hypothetical protein